MALSGCWINPAAKPFVSESADSWGGLLASRSANAPGCTRFLLRPLPPGHKRVAAGAVLRVVSCLQVTWPSRLREAGVGEGQRPSCDRSTSFCREDGAGQAVAFEPLSPSGLSPGIHSEDLGGSLSAGSSSPGAGQLWGPAASPGSFTGALPRGMPGRCRQSHLRMVDYRIVHSKPI